MHSLKLGIPILTMFIFLMACQKSIINQPVPIINAATESGDASLAVVTREYLVTPSLTDPAINTFNQKHFASVQEGGVRKNVLFVFLPGSYRIPVESKGILQKSVSLGFHAIGLMYPNTNPVNPLCGGTNDVTCHRRARNEVIDGIDRHPSINVNPANSILNRLTKLLVYLNKTYPTQGWSQYLVNGKPNWAKIMISGHSQGGALAGLIGKLYPVKKVIIFSMMDFLKSGRWPDWEDLPANKSKYFAISNTQDELVPYYIVKIGWSTAHLGLLNYGTYRNCDWVPYPYNNAHALITQIIPKTTLVDKFHNSTAIDTYIPKDAKGKFIYDKAWEYLLTAQ
ncbi:MAG: hypothetical protein ABI415_01240 [Flavitalea sp.]